jgi:1,2-phenylacetyl-CoA epoxidase catalytic subunit
MEEVKLLQSQVSASHADSKEEIVKNALKKVQAAWQKTTDERITMMGEMNLPKNIEEGQTLVTEQDDEDDFDDDLFD